MRIKILLALVSVVLVAGCTNVNIPGLDGLNLGGTQVGTARGLEITSFTADPTTVYSGSKVRVAMNVQNLGGTTVAGNKSFVYLSGTNVDLDSGDNRYWTSDTSQCRLITTAMDPADVVRGTPADEKPFTWSITAPQLTAGQTNTYTLYGRVYTDYSTAVNGNIWAYAEGEADAVKAAGKALNSASFTTTPGPVGLGVRVSPNPVIYYDTGEKFSLHITISNNAAGTIYQSGMIYGYCNPSINANNYNKVKITLDYDTSKIRLDNAGECQEIQELPSGRSTTVVCDFTLLSSPQSFESYPINIVASYGYYLERQISVTVQGKS